VEDCPVKQERAAIKDINAVNLIDFGKVSAGKSFLEAVADIKNKIAQHSIQSPV
jgi:hypothetical protein